MATAKNKAQKAKAKKPKRKPKPKSPPEQKLGDTPVAPWDMPTSKEKKQARPVRKVLKKAVAKVDSQAKADKVISKLEKKAAGKTAAEVEKSQPTPSSPADAAQQVKAAVEAAPQNKKTEKALEATAKVLTTEDKRSREAVAEAVQEVLNPEQQGTPTVAAPQQREYLRKAVLKRLNPIDGLDANLFLAVNHLPHTRPLNAFFYALTFIFTGGAAWYADLGITALRKRRIFGSLMREVALPLLITNLIVEYPIKSYFKRRRPFITIIQAIVIGKKPGTWSFPSGHSATAFAGAWLLNRKFPRWRGLRYFIASLVAFSRVYLGDHYPGDVMSGSLVGLLFAMFFGRFMRKQK
jgi:membrane-associated phospholipid phosphatase